MCGLIALVALQQQKLRATTIDSIDHSLERIKHRGPDSQGKWISPSSRIGPLQFDNYIFGDVADPPML